MNLACTTGLEQGEGEGPRSGPTPSCPLGWGPWDMAGEAGRGPKKESWEMRNSEADITES